MGRIQRRSYEVRIQIIMVEKKVRPLPRNRRELFFEVLRNQWFKIVLLSLSVSIFFIPFITAYMLKAVHVSSYMATIPEGITGNEATSYLIQLLYIEMMWMAIILVTLIIGFIGLFMGMNYLKSLVFVDELTTFTQHFWKKFKDSLRDGIILGIVNGVVLFALKVAQYLLVIYRIDTLGFVGVILSVVVYLVIFGIDMYALSMNPFYKLTMGQLFKNSFLLYFARLLRNLVIELLAFGLLIFAMVFGQIFVSEIILMIYVGIMFGLGLLIITIANQITLDEFINEQFAPELLNNHIYPEGVDHE